MGRKDDDQFWEEGGFIEKVKPEEIEEKLKTLHKGHNEDVIYNCRKCNKKISAHNKDWHNGMCDDCFSGSYSRRR